LVPSKDLTAKTSAGVRAFLYRRTSENQPYQAQSHWCCPIYTSLYRMLGKSVLVVRDPNAHEVDAQL
jgi:hypothetical protein